MTRIGMICAIAILHTGCVSMALFGWRDKQRELDGAGRVTAPAALSSITRAELEEVVVYELRDIIDSFFWMGSSLPVRAILTVAAGAPDRPMGILDNRAVWAAAERCGKSMTVISGEGAVRVANCTYEANGHVEPSWLVSAVDPGRRVAMAYRVFQRDASREKAIRVLAAAMASYQPAANSQTLFDAVRDRPRRDDAAAALREEKMLAWFGQHGWPRPRLEETVRHENCAYRWTRQLRAGIEIACLAGGRPAAMTDVPDWVREINHTHEVTVVEYRWFRDHWQLVEPGRSLNISSEPWAAFQGDSFQRDQIYTFLAISRYFHYAGVGEERDHEPRFLDEFQAARGRAGLRLQR